MTFIFGYVTKCEQRRGASVKYIFNNKVKTYQTLKNILSSKQFRDKDCLVMYLYAPRN
jgi:hypothetical protein